MTVIDLPIEHPLTAEDIPDTLSVDELAALSYRNAKERGFWPDHADNILDYVAMYAEARVEGREQAASAIHETLRDYLYKNVGPTSPLVTMTGLMLVVTELAEAAETIRDGHPLDERWEEHGKPEGFFSEVADAFVRLSDQIDRARQTAREEGREVPSLNDELVRKMRYNAGRPYRHGGKTI